MKPDAKNCFEKPFQKKNKDQCAMKLMFMNWISQMKIMVKNLGAS